MATVREIRAHEVVERQCEAFARIDSIARKARGNPAVLADLEELRTELRAANMAACMVWFGDEKLDDDGPKAA